MVIDRCLLVGGCERWFRGLTCTGRALDVLLLSTCRIGKSRRMTCGWTCSWRSIMLLVLNILTS